jgi:hypothetical protein
VENSHNPLHSSPEDHFCFPPEKNIEKIYILRRAGTRPEFCLQVILAREERMAVRLRPDSVPQKRKTCHHPASFSYRVSIPHRSGYPLQAHYLGCSDLFSDGDPYSTMVQESVTQSTGLILLSALMLVLGYLFFLAGQLFVTLVLLFIGIVLALTIASKVLRAEKS